MVVELDEFLGVFVGFKLLELALLDTVHIK